MENLEIHGNGEPLATADADCRGQSPKGTNKFGLIGRTLGHSWSQRWFESMFLRENIAGAEYRLYEFPSLDDLRQWVADTRLQGFNVTIPYKESVIPYLDDLDDVARSIGAVNCVAVRQGRLIGHNTDSPAFRDTLRPLLRPAHSSALILGTGGAAKAVAHALRGLGIDPVFVSRNPESHLGSISYSEAVKLLPQRLILVNATPVGMHPDAGITPWPDCSHITSQHICYDLIYNPEKTRFLQDCAARGAQTVNGLAMLERQALLSWQIWTGCPL